MIASPRRVLSVLLNLIPILAIKAARGPPIEHDSDVVGSRLDAIEKLLGSVKSAVTRLEDFTVTKTEEPGECRIKSSYETIYLSRTKEGGTSLYWNNPWGGEFVSFSQCDKPFKFSIKVGDKGYVIKNAKARTMEKLNKLSPFSAFEEPFSYYRNKDMTCHIATRIIERASELQNKESSRWIGEMIENNKEELLKIAQEIGKQY